MAARSSGSKSQGSGLELGLSDTDRHPSFMGLDHATLLSFPWPFCKGYALDDVKQCISSFSPFQLDCCLIPTAA